MNGDFQQVLNRLITQMKMSSDENKKLQFFRSAARKLVRSTNILRSEQDNDWPGSLQEHRTRFIARYPSLANDMDELMAMSSGAQGNLADSEKRLINFANWLNAEFQSHKF